MRCGAPGGRLYASEQGAGLFERVSGLIREAADRIRNVLAAPMKAWLSAPPVGQTWKTYYSASSQLIALRVLTETGNTLYYLHTDHLGSTSLTTDSSGNVVARQNYYPFGQIRPGGTGTMPTDIAFTGQRNDSYIKLYQMGARWYDPEIGRWISPDTIVPDPSHPQQFNRFSYVSNNPVNRVDPTGHVECDNETDAEGCHQDVRPMMKAHKQYGELCAQRGGRRCDQTSFDNLGESLKKDIDNVRDTADSLLYDTLNLPSGAGLQGSGCIGGDMGFGIEGCGSAMLVVNWRSGQIGLLFTGELSAKVGIPSGLSFSGSAGPVVVWHASDLKQLFGSSEFQELNLNLDALFELGGNVQTSISLVKYDSDGNGIDDAFRPLVDPKSGKPVTTWSGSLQVGVSSIPTILAGNVKSGVGYTPFACVFDSGSFTFGCSR
jgi:RHS repeat-associated protein